MRVSNDTLRLTFLNALEAAQRRIVDTQKQVSTGRRVNSPSDDPVAAARIAQLDAALSKLDQFRANGDVARTQLGFEETALADVIDNMQRIRELAVQANNATLSDPDRAVIARELRETRAALLALANTTDAEGKFLFAGYSEHTQPFTNAASGGVIYNGDQGQRSVQISETRFVAINDPGSQIFQRIPTGNGTFTLAAGAGNTGTAVLGAGTVTNPTAWVRGTYTISFTTPTTYEVRQGATLISSGNYNPAGQSIAFLGIDVVLEGAAAAGDTFTVAPSTSRDVFATVDAMIAALEAPTTGTAGQAQLHNKIGQLLLDVDQATDHMITARSDIGARVRALDEEAALAAGFSEQLAQTVSELRDLDYAEALSRLSQQLFGLEAAQQAFARTQGLSLFKYI